MPELTGYLPKTLRYFLGASLSYQITAQHDRGAGGIEERNIQARMARVADEDKPATLITARRKMFGSTKSVLVTPETLATANPKSCLELVVPNAPFHIQGVLSRGYHTMCREAALCVLNAENMVLPMAVRDVADLIQHGNIRDGQILRPVIWSKIGSDWRLIRVGSLGYDSVVADMAYDQRPAIRYKTLEAGSVLVDKDGTRLLYLGEGNQHGTPGTGYVFIKLADHLFQYEGTLTDVIIRHTAPRFLKSPKFRKVEPDKMAVPALAQLKNRAIQLELEEINKVKLKGQVTPNRGPAFPQHYYSRFRRWHDLGVGNTPGQQAPAILARLTAAAAERNVRFNY